MLLGCTFLRNGSSLLYGLSPSVGVGASSCQSPWSTVVCFFDLYLVLLLVLSYNITPPPFRSSYIALSTYFHLPCSHYYLLHPFSPHDLTIPVLLILFPHLCLPHLPLLLFLQPLSSQSSLFPSSISTLSFLLFLGNFAYHSQCSYHTSRN